MRIGIDGRELEKGTMTGMGRHVINFLTHATKARPAYHFILYGKEKTEVPISTENLTVKIIPERVTLWWDQVSLPRALQDDKVDVFLSPYIKGPFLAPCPYVTTIHGLIFLKVSVYTGWRYGIYNGIFKQWGRFLSRRSSTIITSSLHSKQDIIELFRIRPSKIVVIPIGTLPEFRPIQDRQAAFGIMRKYGVSSPYLLYVGNFKPHKNLRRLLEACRKVLKNLNTGHQLVLAGKDERYRPEIEKTVKDLDLAASVTFTGLVSDEDLPFLYNGAQAFVFPSLYEGFGIPVLEAMACGTPVITSKVTSLPEIVGDAGLLIDPENIDEMARAIHLLLTDSALCEKLILKGLERSKLFSIEQTSGKILNLLERIGDQ